MIDHDQKAITTRFAREIRSGSSIFQGKPKLSSLPFAIDDEGKERPIFGINCFILMQLMYRNGIKDPRFIDLASIEKRNWQIAENADNPVRLGFYKLKDEHGQFFDVPKKYDFQVQNGADIHGIPEYHKSHIAYSVEQIAAAYELGKKDDVASFVAATCQEPSSNQYLREMHSAMVQSLINVETKLHFQNTWDESLSNEIADYLEKNPLAIYETAKSAYHSVSQFLQPVQEHVNSLNIAKQMHGETTMYRNFAHEKKVADLYLKSQAILHVPFVDKKEAGELGAIWNPQNKLWFVPEGLDLSRFDKWNPDKTALSVEAARSKIIEAFKDAMADCGLDSNVDIEDDGKWHYVSVLTKKSNHKNKSGSYILTLEGQNGKPSGHIFNRDSGDSLPWQYEGVLMTPEQRAHMMAQARIKMEEKNREEKELQDQAAQHAKEIMALSNPAVDFPYALKKGMVTQNLRQISGEVLKKYPEFISESGGSIIRSKLDYMLVPMYNIEGELRAVQAISPDGVVKSFMRNGQKSGTYFLLGADSLEQLANSKVDRVAYAEGIATSDSFGQIINCPVLVCFDAGNMPKIVELTNKILPKECERIIAADNDQFFMEKMIGALSEKLGIVVNPINGKQVEIQSSQNETRKVGLGIIEADDTWHKIGKGSYKLHLEYDKDVVVRASLNLVVGNKRQSTLKYNNRGIQAAKECETLLSKDNRSCLVAIPSFDSLEKRPTDWNDLLRESGMERAIKCARHIDGLVTPVIERKLELDKEKSRGILGNFKLNNKHIER